MLVERTGGDAMKMIEEALFKLSDADYREFSAKITPNIDKETILGVRIPVLRSYAKTLDKETREAFLKELPHCFFEENMLHVVLLSGEKDYRKALEEVEAFLPYADNWALTDSLNPVCFKKKVQELLPEVKRWIASPHDYTCRFGLCMLMRYYLDEAFSPELLELPLSVTKDEYYLKMMVAWYYATALAKKWDATIPYIEKRRLSLWTHRKTIQKAIESYRITEEQKRYLRTLR